MSSEPNGNGGKPWSMGLAGWIGQTANLTATAVICLMFWQSQSNLWEQTREDRAIYQAQMSDLRRDTALDREAMLSLAHTVEALADEVRAMKKEGKP